MSTPFWSNQPQILWDTKYLADVWPSSQMSFDAQLNAITRLTIYLTFFGYLTTFNLMYLITGILTILAIYIIYKFRKTPLIKKTLEGFSQNKSGWDPQVKDELGKKQPLSKFMDQTFYDSSSNNPFGNVLLTEITDDPKRQAAQPAFNPETYVDIVNDTKRMVQEQNPGIKNTNYKLFGDLWNKFELDFCLRNFYTTPNTRIPNDQGAYADYLYGTMPSCKDGNAFECVKDNLRYILI